MYNVHNYPRFSITGRMELQVNPESEQYIYRELCTVYIINTMIIIIRIKVIIMIP